MELITDFIFSAASRIVDIIWGGIVVLVFNIYNRIKLVLHVKIFLLKNNPSVIPFILANVFLLEKVYLTDFGVDFQRRNFL